MKKKLKIDYNIKIKKILIIGSGNAGMRHLSIAKIIFPDSSLMILKHNEKENLSFHNIQISYTIRDAMNFKPDLVVIANPAPHHISFAKQFLKIKSHLLIEKPLTDKIENITKFYDIFLNYTSQIMVGYNLRFLPSLNLLREMIRNESIGKILSIRCETGQYLPNWRPKKDYRNTVSAKKDLGGGVLLELSHEIDYIRWIFGEFNWVQAYIGKHSNLEIDVEDNVNIICGFKGMKKNSLTATINLDFFRNDPTRKCIIIGEKGTLIWDGIEGNLKKFEKNKNKWQIFNNNENIQETYKQEWISFINSIESNVSPKVTFQDGLQVIKIIEAIKKSHQNKRLEYVDNQ